MILIFLAYAVFVTYLGKFAFSSPDPKHCWYIDGLNTSAFSVMSAKEIALARNIPVKDGYPVDMAHIFRAWFKWGFWGSIA